MQEVKKEFRKTAREKRKAILNRDISDKKIAEKLFALDEFKMAKTILIYASIEDEIRTDDIINCALESGKNVAVPLCSDEKGNMDFYLIDSLSELETGMFGVREPNADNCDKLSDFSDSIIIVPGLSFDKFGKRIGYGKGYYDRFLSRYSSFAIGLCYDEMIACQLPADEYDKSVDLIITQSDVIKCNNGGRNG